MNLKSGKLICRMAVILYDFKFLDLKESENAKDDSSAEVSVIGKIIFENNYPNRKQYLNQN